MNLRTVDLLLLLNTSDRDLLQDLCPALTCVFRYDRNVGYLALGWPRLATQGVVAR